MAFSDIKITSKLPGTGTSIFAVMSALAAEHNAINLSQGFPDFPISEGLIELVNRHMRAGHNQYAPMPGLPGLREAIASKALAAAGRLYDPGSEVTITSGATQALYTAITAFIKAGDEVIVFEPVYDSYVPAVELSGGVARHIRMHHPDYHIDWDEVAAAVNSRTRMIIINSPHNPTGSILTRDDMLRLSGIVRNTDILVLSDEVYEHLIFDGQVHESICRYEELAVRGFAVGSFGKTFHATGWKLGYCMAPAPLMAEFRKVHQFVVFSSNTPIQHAIAEYLQEPAHYLDLPAFYQAKRDAFLRLIDGSRFKPLPCRGTYFQLLDYSVISDETEAEFAIRLTRDYGVASIPTSAFYHDKTENRVLRFCFAKQEETIAKAAGILCRI